MPKPSKRIQKFTSKVDRNIQYDLSDAIGLLKDCKTSKFDETIEIAVKLGIDPKKTDQIVRGSCVLPNGTGKTIRVLVFTQGENVAKAQEAGADYVGGNELAEKIQGGWFDFERIVASPDMMGVVGKIGRLLGPKGLMPNPKVGTVTTDPAKAVEDIKKGQAQFRNDKGGNIHVSVGKISFGNEKLIENIKAVIESIIKLKPATSKGIFFKGLSISSTMGPGIKVNHAELTK